MKDMYDGEYLRATLNELKRALDDLATWSVYNDDREVDAISQLQKDCEELEESLLRNDE